VYEKITKQTKNKKTKKQTKNKKTKNTKLPFKVCKPLKVSISTQICLVGPTALAKKKKCSNF